MRKKVLFMMTAVLILSAGAAFGQECRQLNVTLKVESPDLDPEDFEFLADYFGVDDFDWCWSQRVIGTIQGTWVFCGSWALFADDPLGVGIGPELYGNPGIIYTRKGNIYTMSYGLSVWDGAVFVAFGGLTRYLDGTGAYSGATGYSTDGPMKYPPTYWIQSKGFLCVPD